MKVFGEFYVIVILMLRLVVVVVLSEAFRGMGAWRNSTENQESGHASKSGPEVKNGRSSAKYGAPERLGCGTIQEEVNKILQRVSAGAARRFLHQRLATSTWWCGPRPSYERWAEMARQLPRRVRPSGRPNRLNAAFRTINHIRFLNINLSGCISFTQSQF